MRFRNAEIRRQQRDRFRDHGRPAICMNGELIARNVFADATRRNQIFREHARLVRGEHPAHHVATEDIEYHVQLIPRLRRRAFQFGDVPAPQLIRTGRE